MAIESDADRLAMMSPDDFGVAATWGAVTVYGIFDDTFALVNEATGEVATSGPQFVCRTSDVSSAVQGNTITINTVTWKIIGVQADGTGITVLLLSRD